VNSFVYRDNNLYGNHLKAKIRPFQYFYFQSDFHQLFEFNKIDNTDNRLTLFQFNINYDRIRFEKFNFGWNLGATYVGNEVKNGGLSYGLNAEYFMGNHISFLGSAKWSRINNLPVNAFELQIKFHRKNYFFSIGLEHLKIATPTYDFIALGVGIYF
jgi:long-subunit fatty acid transport protein